MCWGCHSCSQPRCKKTCNISSLLASWWKTAMARGIARFENRLFLVICDSKDLWQYASCVSQSVCLSGCQQFVYSWRERFITFVEFNNMKFHLVKTKLIATNLTVSAILGRGHNHSEDWYCFFFSFLLGGYWSVFTALSLGWLDSSRESYTWLRKWAPSSLFIVLGAFFRIHTASLIRRAPTSHSFCRTFVLSQLMTWF